MTDTPNRGKIIDALLTLLASEPLERIAPNDIAKAAGVSLADLRGEFPSVIAIVAAHMKDVDRKVLAADTADMGEEPARATLIGGVVVIAALLANELAAMRTERI